jgi:hypothetical protein
VGPIQFIPFHKLARRRRRRLPVVVARRLLPEDVSILLGEGGAKLAAAGVEPLLLQDLGQAGVSLKLAQAPAAHRGNLRNTCFLID